MAKFTGNPDYKHDSLPCAGVLVTNLGTPDSATPADVRKYLAEFLSDPRVIEVPKPIWWLILHGIILRTRPKRSAHAYQKVWTEQGSPLLSISRKIVEGIQHDLDKRLPDRFKVELAMRYGNPSIKYGLEKLQAAGAERIVILPLYPQYSATTTASTFDAVANTFRKWRWLPELRMINHYHDDPGYIKALAESISAHWQRHGRGEKLLFSFHGIPKHYFLAGDPYHCECHKTARLAAEALQLKDDQWQVSFQSRFGPREWLKPYTDHTLKDLAKHGMKSVDVICPGFPADCLETLEEINIQYRTLFLENGGEKFSYIPALNDSPAHVAALTDLILKLIQGWPESLTGRDRHKLLEEAGLRDKRATSLRDRQHKK